MEYRVKFTNGANIADGSAELAIEGLWGLMEAEGGPMKKLVLIGSLCLPLLSMAQTAEVTLTVADFTWDYEDMMGVKVGTLDSDPSASESLDLNLQGKSAIEVKWQAPVCKAYSLTLPASIGDDLEFVPTVDEGGGAYSAPYTGISDESLAMTEIISANLSAPTFSAFPGYSAKVASNNNQKVWIQSAFDSVFSEPAGTVYTFRSLTLTGSINSSLNVSNRSVRPRFRLQMEFDNTVTSDPGTPMTIVDACPGAPTNLNATPLDGAVKISFVAGTDNGSAISNYAYSIDGGEFTALATPDSQSPITIPNLVNGQTYSVALRAVNAVGEGAGSVALSVTPEVPDSDGDGVNDALDAFPNDPTETVDSDGDGVGDNRDAFPNDPARWAAAVPAMPASLMMLLSGLLVLLGVRKL